jgi:Plasmid recombination enzyme.
MHVIFLGGRKLLSDMQTDFANRVSHIGLERGIEGSRAKHTKIKEHYAEIQKPIKKDTYLRSN